MNAQTELNTYTADMLRFHPPRMWDRDAMGSWLFRKPESGTPAIVISWPYPQGWVVMIHNWRINASNRLRLSYKRSLSWKLYYRKRLLKEVVYYFQNRFRTILNLTTSQGLWYLYEDPPSEFFLQFHFFSDKNPMR